MPRSGQLERRPGARPTGRTDSDGGISAIRGFLPHSLVFTFTIQSPSEALESTRQLKETEPVLTAGRLALVFTLESHNCAKLGLARVTGDLQLVSVTDQDGLVPILCVPHASAPAQVRPGRHRF